MWEELSCFSPNILDYLTFFLIQVCLELSPHIQAAFSSVFVFAGVISAAFLSEPTVVCCVTMRGFISSSPRTPAAALSSRATPLSPPASMTWPSLTSPARSFLTLHRCSSVTVFPWIASWMKMSGFRVLTPFFFPSRSGVRRISDDASVSSTGSSVSPATRRSPFAQPWTSIKPTLTPTNAPPPVRRIPQRRRRRKEKVLQRTRLRTTSRTQTKKPCLQSSPTSWKGWVFSTFLRYVWK